MSESVTAPTLQHAMETLHRTGSVRLQGAPAVWSKTLLVLFRILMGLVILLAVGGLVGIICVSIVADNPPWFGMIFGYVTSLGMLTGLFLLIHHGLRRQEQFRQTERHPVILEPRGLTLRGIGPIPWADFGPADKQMVPAERDEGYVLRAVMQLTASGLFNVNERTPPEMRDRLSPAMGPFWNKHHRYIYVPGVEGLKQAEVMHLINAAHQLFGHRGAPPPNSYH